MSSPAVTLEIVGEGKTDIDKEGQPPTEGVIPILVHALCGKPANLRIKRRPFPFLQAKKSLWQKVKLTKREAYYHHSDGLVFVVDTEGDRKKLKELERGRDSVLPHFPAAVGAPHPCIEAWLLADAKALASDFGTSETPPERPESLPAPAANRKFNPKTELARCAGIKRDVSAAEKSRLARSIMDLNLVRQRCPISFAPFADEIEKRIKPLFEEKSGSSTPP